MMCSYCGGREREGEEYAGTIWHCQLSSKVAWSCAEIFITLAQQFTELWRWTTLRTAPSHGSHLPHVTSYRYAASTSITQLSGSFGGAEKGLLRMLTRSKADSEPVHKVETKRIWVFFLNLKCFFMQFYNKSICIMSHFWTGLGTSRVANCFILML